jgi:hypothetical protein
MAEIDEFKRVHSYLADEGESKKVDNYAWVRYSLCAAVAFGFQNYLLGDISTKYGLAGVFPLFIGYVPLWIVYRFYVQNLGFYKEKPHALWGVIFRGLVQAGIFFCMATCFSYADKVNVNKGVIASLFTSTIVFTSLIFRVVYREEISIK